MARKRRKKRTTRRLEWRKDATSLCCSFLICLILLASCSHPSSSDWHLEQLHAGSLQHSSSKLTHYTHDKIHGIDLEFLNTAEGLTCYLNVHSVRLNKDTKGFLFIENAQYPLEAHVRSGGQRVRLSDKTCHLIVETLLSGKDIEIRLPGYRALISSQGFQEKFERMEEFSSLRNPFHSPF